MNSISSSQMRELDRKATEIYGIPSLTLMENAGRGVAELITAKKVLVVCGKGNNAGDGFVIARYLNNRKVEVEVLLLAPEAELKGDAAVNYKLVSSLREQGSIDLDSCFRRNDMLVDAIFGIGLKSDVAGIYKETIQAMNDSGKPIMAVDIPSGLDADTGEVRGIAVKATTTATMGYLKHGLLRGEGPHYCGKIVVVDIGIPKALAPA